MNKEETILAIERLKTNKAIGVWNRRFVYSCDMILLRDKELTGKQKFTLLKIIAKEEKND